MIKLRTLLKEGSFPHIKTQGDYIGGIVQGEVRAEPVETGKVKFYMHNDFPGLFSGQNTTNWRYSKDKNVVTWNLPPEKESIHLVDNFLEKRGIKNPKHKSMYNYRESVNEINDTLEWRYWWMDPNLKLHPVEHEGHAGFALNYLNQHNIPRPMGHYEAMYQLGWIRLGLSPYQGKFILAYNYTPSKPPTSRQKKAIKDFAIEIEADEMRDNTVGKWEFIDEDLEYPMAKGDDAWSGAHGDVNWKGKLIWMTPDRFLQLAYPLPEKQMSKNTLQRVEQRFKDQLPVDFLILYVDMVKRKVTGHEGRHRATVAKKMGIEKVPVLIYTGSGFERVPKWDKVTHDVVDKADFAPEK